MSVRRPAGFLWRRRSDAASSRAFHGPSGSRPSAGPPFCSYVRSVQRRTRPVDPIGLPQLIEQHSVESVPYTGGLPIAKPSPTRHSRPAAHLLRQVLPADARLEHEHDARQHRAIIASRSTSARLRTFRRNERFDSFPQRVRYERLCHGSVHLSIHRAVGQVLLGVLSTFMMIIDPLHDRCEGPS